MPLRAFPAPLLALALLAAGCRTPALQPDVLAGSSWALLHLEEGGVARDSLPPDELHFHANGRGVRLRTCNECAGLYALGDRTLEVGHLGCTRRACPADRLELDRYVSGRSAWTLADDRLVLDVDDRVNGIRATLTFRRVAAADTTGG